MGQQFSLRRLPSRMSQANDEGRIAFKAGGDRLDFDFGYLNHTGSVHVRCGAVSDPLAIGQSADAEGFPVCMATVRYSGQGYQAFCGWVQLVRSTDNKSGGREFEMDPLYMFQDAPSPYAFYGLVPSLFDAPSRAALKELNWVAHSFLAMTPLTEDLFANLKHRRVTPVAGFSWGFDIDSRGKISLHHLARLTDPDWRGHLSVLQREYPTWQFDSKL